MHNNNVYTIQEISKMFNLPSSALRYYEDIGLLKNVGRTRNRQRIYNECHVARLHAINCFKETGLPISKMLEFFEFEENLSENIDDIISLINEHEQNVRQNILKMQNNLSHIQHKVRYYAKVKEALASNSKLPCFEEC